jgi:WhiB family redox-sensing transcriptional regulator
MTYPALRTTNRTALFLDGISRDSPDWTEAACIGHDPELWFYGDEDWNAYDEAFSVCEECPIWRECLDYAVSRGERWGMWGGYPPRDRFRLTGETISGHEYSAAGTAREQDGAHSMYVTTDRRQTG